MSKDEFIALAGELAICSSADSKEFDHDGLLAFAALVAAKEREACAQVALHYAKALDYGGNEYMRSHECQLVANAIRARSNHVA